MKSLIKQTLNEPYVELKLPRNKKQKILYNQTFRQTYKKYFFQCAFDFLYSNSVKGDYFEFGVHKARTFRYALVESLIRNLNMNFYAFDSFEGLPDVKNNINQNIFFKKKLLKTSVNNFKKIINPYLKGRKLNIIEGYYQDTLNKELLNKFEKKNLKVAMINIDCDLNESVKKSLDFALNFIDDGTVLYIDDYYLTAKGHILKGNPKIVKDLLKKHKVIYEPWHVCGSSGKSFLLYK